MNIIEENCEKSSFMCSRGANEGPHSVFNKPKKQHDDYSSFKIKLVSPLINYFKKRLSPKSRYLHYFLL